MKEISVTNFKRQNPDCNAHAAVTPVKYWPGQGARWSYLLDLYPLSVLVLARSGCSLGPDEVGGRWLDRWLYAFGRQDYVCKWRAPLLFPAGSVAIGGQAAYCSWLGRGGRWVGWGVCNWRAGKMSIDRHRIMIRLPRPTFKSWARQAEPPRTHSECTLQCPQIAKRP